MFTFIVGLLRFIQTLDLAETALMERERESINERDGGTSRERERERE